MSKVFEDKFSELQADMVSICLEYVENRADEIYIYCSYEITSRTSNFFYKVNGKVLRNHELNGAVDGSGGFRYDTSVERQRGVLNILDSNIKEMVKLCEEYDREMPTEIKLIYNVANNSLKADYRYDMVHSNDPDKIGSVVFLEWFEEMKSNM
ncbi:DUF600 domain-containing protein [Salipaludibacillus sp. LMS25]|jgi:hypothetical protein|uniref:DUF600 domain-containing protein n=1 Tax=Salipaludibacillus sp. LMS25 TaxID=2924031 RepID=UPI0020D1A082|nr:DUF600 domain-containing protein [Salipaludibacillus sp. LMS25]UTR13226.1 DUF600 domain-containing protein [Salipaludibacillus sp. LMS25]